MLRLGQLPSIENLQCFLSAADHLNFRRAAKEMALTPAAFGQRIKQLEEKLGEPLFIRTTRHVELTAAGHRLIPVAESVLKETRKCAEAIHDGDAPARFTIGTRFELGMSWVLPSILSLRETYPDWHVDMYCGSGPDIISQMQMGRVDCVITSAPIARSEWESEFLHPEAYVFVGAKSLLETNPFHDVKDAKNHTLIDITDALPLTRYLTSVSGQMEFKDVWFCGAGEAMRNGALAGLGVCVLPEYMVRADLESGSLVKILPDIELLSDSFRLLFKRGAMLENIYRRVAEHLRERPLE